MVKNKNLHAAKVNKNDEFYTRFDDINFEINLAEHGYRPFFKDKVIYCNCDDPEESNFWKFFKARFNGLKLKKLISTHYDQEGKSSYKLEYDGERVVKTELEGDGDFRSPECVELLKESDIVVTNPPFSLYREFVALLTKYDKKYVIWANNNSITYKEIFPLIKENKMWLGYTCNKTLSFAVPNDYRYDEKETEKISDGKHYGKVPAISVFTNLDIPKRHEPMLLGWKFEKGLEMGIYQKYDNYDAYNVDKVCQIPRDYDGVLGVPITFLDKYCPEQFEILNANDYRTADNVPKKSHGLIKDKEGYIRERESNLCSNLYQENCLHQELTDGTSTANVSMQEYSWYYDMVSRPIIKGIKIYRRMFIKERKSGN